jgi:Domain of unknown function (DUF4113)
MSSYRHKKAGVTFIELVQADQMQAGLFDRPDDARSMARMSAIDALNSRYGRGAVAFGTAGERQVWGCGGNSSRRAIQGIAEHAQHPLEALVTALSRRRALAIPLMAR